MNQIQKIFRNNYGLLLLCLFLAGCANIVPPSGGDIDTTPPNLLSINPPDSSLNKEVYHITLTFDKFMEVNNLNQNLSTSPLLGVLPTVTVSGKTVNIKLPDSSLEPNTSYRISLGNALTDNREQTPYKDFNYIFSTGNYFDSLKIKGRVFNAETGLPDSTATIFLYPLMTTDSDFLSKRPQYVRKVNGDGSFVVDGLPNHAFRALAVKDDDHNFVYGRGTEKFDFQDSLVTPQITPDTDYVFYIFQEDLLDTTRHTTAAPVDSSQNAEAADKTDRFGNRAAAPKGRAKPSTPVDLAHPYRVLVDTVLREKGNFDLNDSLLVTISVPLQNIDTDRIYLSYDDGGIEAEAERRLNLTDSSKMYIIATWKPATVYTLRLIKDWATDTAGNSLEPGKFSFKTKSAEDYATLNITVDSAFVGDTFRLELRNDRKMVWSGAVLKQKLTVPLLSPGDYHLKLIFDKNKNGRWDPGDLFAHRHAEKVIQYEGSIHLKEGWVNDIQFKKPEPPQATEPKTDGAQKASRFGEAPKQNSDEK